MVRVFMCTDVVKHKHITFNISNMHLLLDKFWFVCLDFILYSQFFSFFNFFSVIKKLFII